MNLRYKIPIKFNRCLINSCIAFYVKYPDYLPVRFKKNRNNVGERVGLDFEQMDEHNYTIISNNSSGIKIYRKYESKI